jgi:hypothetical protein
LEAKRNIQAAPATNLGKRNTEQNNDNRADHESDYSESISHYGSQATYKIGDFQKKFTPPK